MRRAGLLLGQALSATVSNAEWSLAKTGTTRLAAFLGPLSAAFQPGAALSAAAFSSSPASGSKPGPNSKPGFLPKTVSKTRARPPRPLTPQGAAKPALPTAATPPAAAPRPPLPPPPPAPAPSPLPPAAAAAAAPNASTASPAPATTNSRPAPGKAAAAAGAPAPAATSSSSDAAHEAAPAAPKQEGSAAAAAADKESSSGSSGSGSGSVGDAQHHAGDAGASSEPHPFAARLGPVLQVAEQTEVARLLKGTRHSDWTRFRLTPYERFQRGLRSAVGRLFRPLTSSFRNRMRESSERLVKDEVEYSFDMAEFAEGCTQAAELVLQRFGSGDLDSGPGGVGELVSEALLESMRAAHREAADGGNRLEAIQVTWLEVEPSVVNLWGVDSVRQFDARWADQVSDSTSSSWLVAMVRVQADMILEFQAPAAPRKPPAAVGLPGRLLGALGLPVGAKFQWLNIKVPAEMIADREFHRRLMEGASVPAKRRGTWVFCRGPLPRGAVSELTTPWQVLGWYS